MTVNRISHRTAVAQQESRASRNSECPRTGAARKPADILPFRPPRRSTVGTGQGLIHFSTL